MLGRFGAISFGFHILELYVGFWLDTNTYKYLWVLQFVKLEGSQFTDLGDVHQSSMLATNHFEQDHVTMSYVFLIHEKQVRDMTLLLGGRCQRCKFHLVYSTFFMMNRKGYLIHLSGTSFIQV